MMSSNKKFRFPVFWVCFGVFVLILVGFWIWFINSVIVKDLKIYEASQPQYVMDEVAAKIQSGDISSMNFADSMSRFEDGSIYKDTFAASISGKTITYEKNPKSYDAQAPFYELYANGEHIATVSLRSTSYEQLMFILSVQEWEVESVVPIYETGDEGLVIRMPDSYKAYVNGIELDDREKTGNVAEYSQFKYSKDYVTVPTEVEYSVGGLMTQPTVKITDAFGNDVPVEKDGTTYIAGFAGSQISDDMSAYVLNNAKTYSNFFSRDLAGCDNSINGIRYMFPEGSDYLTLAENYRLHDMWMYSGHQAPVFSNEKVSNYIKYSDNFFRVDVYFEKSMYLTRTGDTRVDITNSTYYYVNINGSWVIADMVSIIDDNQ